ncbi:uncharacterized protein METZ01_LOCUS425296 [marine metagenome]|uniref:Uncharacterized protein n=1 Tax=marine metagenome TaxID=408172 RepID=A0A382XMV8_9ZZZZ
MGITISFRRVNAAILSAYFQDIFRPWETRLGISIMQGASSLAAAEELKAEGN